MPERHQPDPSVFSFAWTAIFVGVASVAAFVALHGWTVLAEFRAHTGLTLLLGALALASYYRPYNHIRNTEHTNWHYDDLVLTGLWVAGAPALAIAATIVANVVGHGILRRWGRMDRVNEERWVVTVKLASSQATVLIGAFAGSAAWSVMMRLLPPVRGGTLIAAAIALAVHLFVHTLGFTWITHRAQRMTFGESFRGSMSGMWRTGLVAFLLGAGTTLFYFLQPDMIPIALTLLAGVALAAHRAREIEINQRSIAVATRTLRNAHPPAAAAIALRRLLQAVRDDIGARDVSALDRPPDRKRREIGVAVDGPAATWIVATPDQWRFEPEQRQLLNAIAPAASELLASTSDPHDKALPRAREGAPLAWEDAQEVFARWARYRNPREFVAVLLISTPEDEQDETLKALTDRVRLCDDTIMVNSHEIAVLLPHHTTRESLQESVTMVTDLAATTAERDQPRTLAGRRSAAVATRAADPLLDDLLEEARAIISANLGPGAVNTSTPIRVLLEHHPLLDDPLAHLGAALERAESRN